MKEELIENENIQVLVRCIRMETDKLFGNYIFMLRIINFILHSVLMTYSINKD